MKIGLVCQYFPPEVAPIGTMISELAHDLVASGHEVTVFTGYPNHPKGEIFQGYRARFSSDTFINDSNVQVCRNWLFISPSKAILTRAINYISFSLSAFLACIKSHHDVYLIVSPPLTNILIGFFLRLFGKRYVLSIQDIYPDAAVVSGILKNRIVIRFFLFLEKLAYRFSDRVIVISNGFARNIAKKNISSNKICVIPNWIDSNEIKPGARCNTFSQEYCLTKSFTVLYSGTVGRVSGAQIMLELGSLLASDLEIVLMIVGDGVVKDYIEEQVKLKRLANIRFAPFQPRARLPDVLSSASVGLVTLLPGHGANSVPSKILGYLAAERPVIASVDPGSDTWQFVEEAKCGLCTPPGDAVALARAIILLKDNPEIANRLGENGRRYLEQNLNRAKMTSMYEQALRNQ